MTNYKSIIEKIRHNKKYQLPRLYLLDEFMWYKWKAVTPKEQVNDKNDTKIMNKRRNHRTISSLKEYQDCSEIQ